MRHGILLMFTARTNESKHTESEYNESEHEEPSLSADSEIAVSPHHPHSVVSYRVLVFAILRDALGSEAVTVCAPERSLSVAHLLKLLSEQHQSIASFLPYVRVAVNFEYSNADAHVSPHDEIALLPPVSGGQGSDGDELPLVELTHDAIDTQRVIESCRSRLAGGEGAVLTFEGVVRDNANGHDVHFLEYSCYEPMALREMQKISDEVQTRWQIPCAIMHRLGRCEIGEASVVICVASPHRAPAFEACRHAIDRLKETVPIWKKETARDGAWWVENPVKNSVEMVLSSV